MNQLRKHAIWGWALVPWLCWAQGAPGGKDLAPREEIDPRTFSGIARCGADCPLEDARQLGLVPTGLRPLFDPQLDCRDIDDGWAVDYTARRPREFLHAGIDIPAPKGTPVLAVADGEVVALFNRQDNTLGHRVFLRHTPSQTGKPFWVYTEYAHLETLEGLQIGQRLGRGAVIGRTSNSGLVGQAARSREFSQETGKRMTRIRRDALHFSVLYSENPRYHVASDQLIPVSGRWMDPLALFRSSEPYDSARLAQLPGLEKAVPVPAAVEPTPTSASLPRGLLVWPYACTKRAPPG